MGKLSERRLRQRQESRARMKAPGGESVYALKRQGIYPPNSPYRTGEWGHPRPI